MKIIKYQTVQTSSVGHLEKLVKEYIDMGWQPYGNLVVITTGHYNCNIYYTQVMVKYED